MGEESYEQYKRSQNKIADESIRAKAQKRFEPVSRYVIKKQEQGLARTGTIVKSKFAKPKALVKKQPQSTYTIPINIKDAYFKKEMDAARGDILSWH